MTYTDRLIDIVLVSPPTRASSPIVPFPCIYLASYLRLKGFDCCIVDIKDAGKQTHIRKIEQETVSQILAANSSFVGFTCLSAEYSCVLRMALDLRKQGYKGIVIVGGHHPTFYPGDFLYPQSPFDFVVLGEGEETLVELLQVLKLGGQVHKVPGIAYYRDEVVMTSKRAVLEDLGILPMPSYDLLNMDFYLQPRTSIIRYSIFAGIDVQTTRGCPCQCTYCGNPSLWAVHTYKKRFRCRPIPNVLDELEFLYNRYRIDSFFVNDDSFTVSEQRVRDFCDGLVHRKLDSLVWGMQTRVNIFTEKMAQMVASSGCIQVEFGVESGSERILKLMKKGITLNQIHNAYAICKKYKLRTFANFMINTPTETEEDLKATIALARAIKATHYGFFVTVPLPGTMIYQEYVHPPLKKDEYDVYLGSQPYKRIIDPRFKLNHHRRNISFLAAFLYAQFTAIPLYADPFFSFFRYFRNYTKSVHRKQYLKAVWTITFYRFFKHFLTFLLLLASATKDLSRRFSNRAARMT
ncbi:hypothetical protein BU251_04355 [Candidatus Velamenicoccus archaeovorus]|uniref:Uncharacterized protein n=1 Tax=Velamenicoccus archaeovorus TaxID=1930593 RepID=A0A410P4H5_VELA1|nr:hypothetical protein BU251_04355 [Candidatus Velamenicoccus archaeovorus]